MKKIIFFITHKTLSYDHADMSLKSIHLQNTNEKFDEMYIYNSNSDELKNNDILTICDKYKLNDKIDNIIIFNYDDRTKKTLASDILNIKKFCFDNFKKQDRILILKSDIMLSKNYFDDIFKLPEGDVFYTSPFVCAKKRILNDELIEYINRDRFIESDSITFFTEDTYNTNNNDFNRRDGSIDSSNIKFFSCRVVNDFSCHYISVSLLDNILLGEQSWGGANFSKLLNYHISSDRCFTLHKYHNIKSINRSEDREGPVEDWLLS